MLDALRRCQVVSVDASPFDDDKRRPIIGDGDVLAEAWVTKRARFGSQVRLVGVAAVGQSVPEVVAKPQVVRSLTREMSELRFGNSVVRTQGGVGAGTWSMAFLEPIPWLRIDYVGPLTPSDSGRRIEFRVVWGDQPMATELHQIEHQHWEVRRIDALSEDAANAVLALAMTGCVQRMLGAAVRRGPGDH